MSKLLERIIESTCKNPSPTNSEYLISVIRKTAAKDLVAFNKGRLAMLATRLSEAGRARESIALLDALNESLDNDRYIMLNLASTLADHRYFDRATAISEDLHRISISAFEKVQALDILIKVKSKMACQWHEIECVINQIKLYIHEILDSEEPMTRGKLNMLLGCSYWFSGYFSDDLDELHLVQRISSLVIENYDLFLK